MQIILITNSELHHFQTSLIQAQHLSIPILLNQMSAHTTHHDFCIWSTKLSAARGRAQTVSSDFSTPCWAAGAFLLRQWAWEKEIGALSWQPLQGSNYPEQSASIFLHAITAEHAEGN